MAALKGEPRPTRKPKKSYEVSTLAEVAEFFGLTVQAIHQWRANGEMPGCQGHWDLSAIAAWKVGKGREGSGLTEEQKLADIRLKTAQADAKELENAQTRGGLVDLGDVERWAAAALIELRETVMALPEMIATSAPPEIREFAREETDRHCRAVLLTFQRRLDTDVVEPDEVDE